MKRPLILPAMSIVLCLSLLAASHILASDDQESIAVSIPIEGYEINDTHQGQEISVGDFGHLLVPGKPVLPSRIFAVAIPPGTEFAGISFDTGAGVRLPGSYRIPPAPLPRVIGQEDPIIYEKERRLYEDNYNSVYANNDVYPQNVVEFVRTAGYRKYNLVDVRVTPFAYRPISGELVYFPDISVNVEYETSERSSGVVVDHLERPERIAEEIIINYDQAVNWYPRDMRTDEDFHDFVMITLSSLTSSITPLVDWETQKGRSVEVVTTSWINTNYAGYDLPEKIRNFLREKYPSSEWGVEDVLLVGHYDDVPMRRTGLDLGYGQPETDYYYAELSLPDDQSWDVDGDHLYGEETDYNDFYTEVTVGRIPWSDPNIVFDICEKSVAYEINDDPAFKKNILLLGGFFWDDDPNPRTDCAVLMEAKVDQPWMSDWTMTRMYERGYSSYPMDYDLRHSNVISVWSSGTYAFVNWAGHGSPTSSHIWHSTQEAFISSSDCPQLNDDYPAIIFADACSNSDTDHLNIGQAMMYRGAVGFLGATQVALGRPGWDDPLDGSSQSLDYFFTTSVTSGEYSQGEAHQRALRIMYTYGLWYYVKYETFEWGAYWGNPDLGMAPPVPQALVILFPDGLPEYIQPGVPNTFIVRIENGSENYLPGSGTLSYRYEGGDFSTLELISIGNDLFEATLPPADCEALPEFYISASGDEGSSVSDPPDAPDSYHVSSVGNLIEVMEDDFETDQGWTVSGDAIAGHWERGFPVGGGERGDPARDYDGSGQCYVTGNVQGDSDVDGGYTYLTSPLIYLYGAETPKINYALWYTNNFGENPNRDFFKTYISSDDGSSWILAETVGPASTNGWEEYSIDIADSMTSTGMIKVRFEVSDLEEGSVVEAGIDAFEVLELNCDATSIPDQESDASIPDEFALLGSYPNPFNNRVNIEYALPEQSHVTIEIYDLLGRRVETLVDGEKQAGYHQITWDSRRSSSGLYFYRIQAGDFSEANKMLLLK